MLTDLWPQYIPHNAGLLSIIDVATQVDLLSRGAYTESDKAPAQKQGLAMRAD